jgi:hypothetical protein
MRYFGAILGVTIGMLLVVSWPIGLGLGIATMLVGAAWCYRKHLDSKGCDGL